MAQPDWSAAEPSPPEETARDGMLNPEDLRKAVAEIEGVELSPTYQLAPNVSTFHMFFTPGHSTSCGPAEQCEQLPVGFTLGNYGSGKGVGKAPHNNMQEGGAVHGMSICRVELTVQMKKVFMESIKRMYPRVETALLGAKNMYGSNSRVANKYGYGKHGECDDWRTFTTIETVVDEIKRVQECIMTDVKKDSA